MEAHTSAGSGETRPARIRRRTWRIAVRICSFAAIALVGYSLWIAFREPDRQEIVVFGQRDLTADTPLGMRILVRDRIDQTPIADAQITIALQNTDGVHRLGEFTSDEHGTHTSTCQIPAGVSGEHKLVIEVRSREGEDRVVRSVEVKRRAELLLTTDKPIYQPGQMIRLRALAVNGRTRKPVADQTVLFEVVDPRGNKIFKAERRSSRFGIASAEFELAEEIRHGEYQIMADAESGRVERTVMVKRYALPKFGVKVQGGKPWYRPGEEIYGTVQALYFFGQPVVNGRVVVTQISPPEVFTQQNISGRTDEDGRFQFRTRVPKDISDSNGQLELQVSVTDESGHWQSRNLVLPISRSGLLFSAVPEGGLVVPGVTNRIYLRTTRPDGTPARSRVTLGRNTLSTGTNGLTHFDFLPSPGFIRLDLSATDDTGYSATATVSMTTNSASIPLLLRPDKAVYAPGEELRAEVFSPEPNQAFYVDVLQGEQTIRTASGQLRAGRGTAKFRLPKNCSGRLQLHGYFVDKNGQAKGHWRNIFANPNAGLRIAAKWNSESYRPGSTARLDLSVTDAVGRPQTTGLGLSIVDESVFALAGTTPSFVDAIRAADLRRISAISPDESFGALKRLVGRNEIDQELVAARLSLIPRTNRRSNLIDRIAEFDPSVRRTMEYIDGLRERGVDYEQIKSEYAHLDPRVFELVEGKSDEYSLWSATARSKEVRIRQERRRYIGRLKTYGAMAFGAFLVFGLPAIVLISHERQKLDHDQLSKRHKKDHAVIQAAFMVQRRLLAVVFFSLMFYMYGFLGWGLMTNHMPSTAVMLVVESFAVLGTCLWMHGSLAESQARAPEDRRWVKLKSFPLHFMLQFVFARAFFWFAETTGSFVETPATILLVMGVLFGWPMLVCFLASHFFQWKLDGDSLIKGRQSSPLMTFLALFMILIILAGMLLPALGKAKARSSRIALINTLRGLETSMFIAHEEESRFEDRKIAQSSATSPRIRRHFPETLFWQPDVITDGQGHASLEILVADSITTWRASIDAIGLEGATGATNVPLRVFQDFFVDVDVPVRLTQNDEITIPITCFNYLNRTQSVSVEVKNASWFEPLGRNRLMTRIKPGASELLRFPIRALIPGEHALLVTARGEATSDAIERRVRISPDGHRVEQNINTVLKDRWTTNLTIPADTITNSITAVLKLFPSRFTEVIDGLDGMLRMPHGCFEQTSSTTYPNVLILDYLSRMRILNPQVEARARDYIAKGYQRLIGFEAIGGGFSWFGRGKPDVWLTAYGVFEFTDMSRVHNVDPRIIKHATAWLQSQQLENGSWNHDPKITAYVAWCLAESVRGQYAVKRAIDHLEGIERKSLSTYTRALIANACLARDPKHPLGLSLVDDLQKSARHPDKESVFWETNGRGLSRSYGNSLRTETTALCAMALIKSGRGSDTARKALSWLSAQRQLGGGWGSTQATILAMRAILLGSDSTGVEGEPTKVSVRLNQELAGEFVIGPKNADVLQRLSLSRRFKIGTNRLEVTQSPGNDLPLQLSIVHWQPKRQAGEARAHQAFAINQRYSKKRFGVGESITVTTTVRNLQDEPAPMAMIELNLPPGFATDQSTFDKLLHDGQVARYEIKGSQIHLYLRELAVGKPVVFAYQIHTAQAGIVQAPPARVYEYYTPENSVISGRVRLQTVQLAAGGR